MPLPILTDQTKITSTTVKDLLGQIEQSGAPIRIENETDTYYLLRIDQLLSLLQLLPLKEMSTSGLTAADFGLSETDITAYRKRRAYRRKQIRPHKQQPLDRQLQQRLEQIKQQPALSKEELEEAVKALETAILRNLQAALAV